MSTPQLNIDHLVFVAPTLTDGVAWCERTLGVTPGPGGRHALMSTHNRLLRVATLRHPQAYLEIIAIDPDAPPPGRARWFEMDRRGPAQPVQLAHVVMNTDDLAGARAAFLAAGLDPGPGVTAQRETPAGTLRWCITVRDDGALLCGGALPTLIQWLGPHPSASLAASPLQLHALQLRGLPPALAPLLGSSSATIASGPGPALTATLDTPLGRVELHSA